jgi:hypothetical protein
LRYANGFFDTIDFEPAAKAAANEMIVNDYLFEREVSHFRRDTLGTCDHLIADPDFA